MFGGTCQGRPIYTLSCELVFVRGRPRDWPDCAASANPFLSLPPSGSSSPTRSGELHGEIDRDGRASLVRADRRRRGRALSRRGQDRREARGPARVGSDPRARRRGCVGGDDEQRCDRDDVAPARCPCCGVEPSQDQSDRRGEGQDRQGRRSDPGPVVGRGLPARDLGRGRPNTDAPPAGGPTDPSGQAAHPAEEPGAWDLVAEPCADVPARGPVLRRRPQVALGPGPAR